MGKKNKIFKLLLLSQGAKSQTKGGPRVANCTVAHESTLVILLKSGVLLKLLVAQRMHNFE